jgi:adenosine deaminase
MSMTEPEVRLILLVNRDSPEDFVLEVESTIESGLPPAFVGIDLAGDELRFPDVDPFKRCFSKGAKSGLGVTVHAGEFGGEANIWAALDELGAQRIGHGIASASSRSLLRRLSVDHILMELSITSNLALGAVPSADAHPLPDFMNWGIPVCVNTDVPVYTGASLHDEYDLAGALLRDVPNWFERLSDFSVKYAFRRNGRAAGDGGG